MSTATASSAATAPEANSRGLNVGHFSPSSPPVVCTYGYLLLNVVPASGSYRISASIVSSSKTARIMTTWCMLNALQSDGSERTTAEPRFSNSNSNSSGQQRGGQLRPPTVVFPRSGPSNHTNASFKRSLHPLASANTLRLPPSPYSLAEYLLHSTLLHNHPHRVSTRAIPRRVEP
jgi:hypothetical protein